MSLILVIISLLTLSLPTHSITSQTILTAAQVLSNGGDSVAMSLTLELVADTITSMSPTITVFAPSDEAFSSSGQPSLSLLNLHLSPLTLSPPTLRSFPYGSKIATMSSGQSLTVTSLSSSNLSINNVSIAQTPIYDDGSLIVYEIPQFFNPNFNITTTPSNTTRNLANPLCQTANTSSFRNASQLLISKNFSLTASFLSLQVAQNRPHITVFAPIDDMLFHSIDNFSDYALLLLRHVAPCVVTFADLTNMGEGSVLGTYSEGFNIKVSKSNGLVMVNEIPITFPDMYSSNWLVVHGLHEVLEAVAEGAEAPSHSMQRAITCIVVPSFDRMSLCKKIR